MKSVKLSKREKVLVIALAALALFTIYYFLLLTPTQKALSEARAAKEVLTIDRDQMKLYIETKNEVIKSGEQLRIEAMEAEGKYYPDSDTLSIDKYLTNLCFANNLSPQKLQMTDINVPVYEGDVNALCSTTIKLSVKGSFDSLVMMLNSIENTLYISVESINYSYIRDEFDMIVKIYTQKDISWPQPEKPATDTATGDGAQTGDQNKPAAN